MKIKLNDQNLKDKMEKMMKKCQKKKIRKKLVMSHPCDYPG